MDKLLYVFPEVLVSLSFIYLVTFPSSYAVSGFAISAFLWAVNLFFHTPY